MAAVPLSADVARALRTFRRHDRQAAVRRAREREAERAFLQWQGSRALPSPEEVAAHAEGMRGLVRELEATAARLVRGLRPVEFAALARRTR